MGILSKLFGSKDTVKSYKPKSEQEAWIGIMYACMYIDDHISEKELQEMFDLVEKQPLFNEKHVADYYQPVMLANRNIGSYNLIDSCVTLINENNKELLFELIMQLLLVDGKLKPKEKDIAAYLIKALQLDFDTATKFVDSLLIAE